MQGTRHKIRAIQSSERGPTTLLKYKVSMSSRRPIRSDKITIIDNPKSEIIAIHYLSITVHSNISSFAAFAPL